MAHFAQIDENNIVTKVIVIEQEEIDTGIWGDPDTWVQTSYNTRHGIHWTPNNPSEPDGGIPLRKNFAGLGFTYDKSRDAFIAPKPFDSWVLDEDKCIYAAPESYPDDGKVYNWDEDSLAWELDPKSDDLV